MGHARRFWSPGRLALTAVWLMAAGAAQAGFLPAAPFDLGGNPTPRVTGYGQARDTHFSQDVRLRVCDMDLVIGKMDFDFNTTAITIGADRYGGAALAGQFVFTAGDKICLEPGSQFGWVQVVAATQSGANEWNAPDGTRFPDTQSRGTDPDYPFESLPDGTRPANGVAFQDFPFRGLNPDQTWIAELGLVCKNPTTHVAHIIGTFLWGFSTTNGVVTGDPPHAYGSPTASYITTLQNAFDGKVHGPFTSTKWTFDQNAADCFVCVPCPAPAGLTLVLAGAVAAAGGVRRLRPLAA
ncbi:MAG: hypothetical protein U0871_28645 [Gemmataceae bacterium]